MKIRVIPTRFTPCSCENEGNLIVYLPDHKIELDCYFIGYVGDYQNYFQIGDECESDIKLWHGKIIETNKRNKSLLPDVVGIYTGKEADEDGDTLYLIDSIFTVKTDNELGDYKEPTYVGNWVECSGTFVIDMC